ncbi:MAG: hypothetical protein ACRD0P_15425, partial [Stackebrandtia sp.]
VGPAPWRWLGADAGAVETSGPIDIDHGRRLANSVRPLTELEIPHRAGVPDPIPVIPGRTYTMSAHVADGSGHVGLSWRDADGDEIASQLSDYTNGRIVVTGTAPAGAAGVLLLARLGAYVQSVELDGIDGYAVTPSHADLDVTGDIDLRAELLLDSWTQVNMPRAIARYSPVDDQCSYQLVLVPSGYLRIVWSPNGSSVGAPGLSSTVPIPGQSGRPLCIRATLDVDNGADGHTATFYVSEDFSNWEPLGDPVIGISTTAIAASTTPLSIGARTLPTANRLEGRVLRAEVRDGIDGTIVAAPDFRGGTDGWEPGDDASTAARTDIAGRAWSLAETAEITRYLNADGSGRVGGLQLTETAKAVDWKAGMGMPHIVVSGLDNHQYSRLSGSDKFRDVEITLTEVA